MAVEPGLSSDSAQFASFRDCAGSERQKGRLILCGLVRPSLDSRASINFAVVRILPDAAHNWSRDAGRLGACVGLANELHDMEGRRLRRTVDLPDPLARPIRGDEVAL